MYCLDYKMKLIIFENRTEEEIVQKTWGTRKCQNRQFMIVQSRKLKFSFKKKIKTYILYIKN